MKKALLIIGLLSTTLFSCVKDTVYLTGNISGSLNNTNWNLTGITITQEFGGQKQAYDLFNAADACSKDNFISFKANGVLIADEGSVKCDDMDPQSETGSWSISPDKKKLTLVSPDLLGTAETSVCDVLQLDANVLQIQDTQEVEIDVDGSGKLIKVKEILVISFTKKK